MKLLRARVLYMMHVRVFQSAPNLLSLIVALDMHYLFFQIKIKSNFNIKLWTLFFFLNLNWQQLKSKSFSHRYFFNSSLSSSITAPYSPFLFLRKVIKQQTAKNCNQIQIRRRRRRSHVSNVYIYQKK